MKRRILSIICTLALCLGMLPGTALAAELTTLIVGNVTVVGTGGTGDGYYTQGTDGQWEKWTESGAPAAHYFHYDGNGTLTLNGANITGTNSTYYGAAIYAEGDLTIELEGSSTVTGVVPSGSDTPPAYSMSPAL